MDGRVVMPFYQVGVKGIIQNVKIEQDYGAQTSFITDEEGETERKVMLREISDLPKVVCDKCSFC